LEELTRETPWGTSWFLSFSSYGNLIVLTLLIFIPALVHARLLTQSVTPLRQSLESFPLVLGEWRGAELGEDEWHPKLVGETDRLRRIYKDSDGHEIRIFVSYLPIQTQGQELIYHANRITPPGFKTIAQNSKIWTISANQSSIKLKTKVYLPIDEAPNVKLLCWYKNTGHYLHSRYMAKAFMALDSLLKDRSNGSVFVLIYKSSSYDTSGHEVNIQDFLNSFVPEISKYLPS
jgi:EpsI family protein